MNRSVYAPLLLAVVILLGVVPTAAPQTNNAPLRFNDSPRLQAAVDRALNDALTKFTAAKLTTNELAITLVDLHDAAHPHWASCRGDQQIYPASVIKLFYLAAVHRWLEDGRLKDTEELRRAMRDMIVDSYNEATGLIVDSLTDTTSGPELPSEELARWFDKRNAVNRYFASLGYTNINVNRKPWCEGPYGREMQSVTISKPNHRNWLTTDATARLLSEIATGHCVTPARSQQMMDLLKRDPFNPKSEGQSREYTGAAVPPAAKLWSKAGWTSETRHDAAYVELANGAKLVLVVFTTNHAEEKEIIPFVAKSLLSAFKE